MELFDVALNITALVVNLCLVYLAIRLCSVFKGGTVGKSWLFISFGVLALAIGSSVFSFKYIFKISSFEVHVIGGLFMLLGGVLALIGMYREYRNWIIPK